ncbi:LOW QUALITY PROTEIN: acrosomal protein KIAA1210 [Thalassophryne amazonica]|uniref:LOW QUALITY PROTEIN: acrosomal protein KIAA1210 n=1 Tax=Thalassophryne amazonica TaxID=390379 RepID=UPI001471E0CC|nr:LOW QUALITY PROTEIN: acrosomal protein KIAA1210 [Thalassophryne amazonica]
MESFSGDTEESPEDTPGWKKSKLKSLKNRLFGRSKRAEAEGNPKLSQSVSDITVGKALSSDEDLACSQGMMGSRALSHDSIFLADQVLTDSEPVRVLSNENVHSKIKALQLKLQQQKLHLGPPPLLLPVKRSEDQEDDDPRCSPTETLGGDVTSQRDLSKVICQPVTPTRPTPLKYALPTSSPLLPISISSNTASSVVESPLDFSSPAHFTSCLDTSAARHRMSIKPRNQRASTKKGLSATDSSLNTLNNTDVTVSTKEKKQSLDAPEDEIMEPEREMVDVAVVSYFLSSKLPKPAPVPSEPSKPQAAHTALSHQDHTVPGSATSTSSTSHRPTDVNRSDEPRSPLIQSDMTERGNSSDHFETDTMTQNKNNLLSKSGSTEINSKDVSVPYNDVSTSSTPMAAFGISSIHQQVKDETKNTRGLKRPAPGSGSFHFSITSTKDQDEQRPRSGSWLGMLQEAEDRLKTARWLEDNSLSSSVNQEKEAPTDDPNKPGPPHKSLALPWDKKDSLKRASAKNSAPTGQDLEGKEVDNSQDVKEEAMESQEEEEEAKTTFGVKLRSTSQSLKLRSGAPSSDLKIKLHQGETNPLNPQHAPSNLPSQSCEEQCNKDKKHDICKNASSVFKKTATNFTSAPSTCGNLKPTDGTQTSSGLSVPVKHKAPPIGDPCTIAEMQEPSTSPKEMGNTPQEPQSAPKTVSSEVSWMNLAMEKTRSLQQLFTSRFPRETAYRPQMQSQLPSQEQSESHSQTAMQPEVPAGTQRQMWTVKTPKKCFNSACPNAFTTNAVKPSITQSRSLEQSVKPPVQQKTSVTSNSQSSTSGQTQVANDPPVSPSTSQSMLQPLSHTKIQTAQSAQTETVSPPAHGPGTQSLTEPQPPSDQQATPQQPPWCNRGLHLASQLKSTTSTLSSTSTVTSASAQSPVSGLENEDRAAAMQEQEGRSLSVRRTVWAGSRDEELLFLERRAEWITPPVTKETELKKGQTETCAPAKSCATASPTLPTKGLRHTGFLAESSPTMVPQRSVSREDKWLRKNKSPSSSPSSSPTLASAPQSVSGSSQPSWMELAKKKSMAWTEKNMD